MNELTYPWDTHPTHGTTREVAPGAHWLTMPMGGSLTHINLYMLEDHDGWYVVDTGLALQLRVQLCGHEGLTRQARAADTHAIEREVHERRAQRPDHLVLVVVEADRLAAHLHFSKIEKPHFLQPRE